MADFRGTDRIRRIASAMRQSLRLVRSRRLKGITVVNSEHESKFPSNFSILSWTHRHRKPIGIAAAAVVAAGGIAFAAYRYVQAHMVTYYEVLLAGAPVGEISSKQLVDELLVRKQHELAVADTPERYVLDDNPIAYRTERAYKKKPDDQSTLQKLSGMLKTHPVGVKLIVGGKTVGIVRDQETADMILRRVKNKYLPETTVKSQSEVRALSYSAAEAEPVGTSKKTVQSVEFVEPVTTVPVDIQAGQLSDPEALYKKLVTGNPTPIKYTVKEGDCVGCIAQKMGVSPEVIYKNNPWIVDDIIKPGQVLDLTAKKPMLNVRSVEEVTQLETIEPKVEYVKNDQLRAGQTKVINPGKPGKQWVTYRLLRQNGEMIEEERVSARIVQQAVTTVIMKGTKIVLGEGTGQFAWPVTGHKITSYMGERWGRMHEGIDIVGGKNIMAADNGVVVFAGWKNGYGNCIIIDHKNGFETLYGHMSKLIAKKGQVVQKGDVIGIMGETGHAFGVHLHFEVHKDGVVKNPLSYL